MDLILAHKRAMKLCELCKFSLIVQTSLATAVSEIARSAIEHGEESYLVLGIDTIGTHKVMKAIIVDTFDFYEKSIEACDYARRLVSEVEIARSAKELRITLKLNIGFQGLVSEAQVMGFIEYFKLEPPLSAYDELRRKNLLLQDLAEKIRDSEMEYKILTDSLPLMMFAANNRGVITYSNQWLHDYLGIMPRELNVQAWQAVIHQSDHLQFGKELVYSIQRQIPFKGQYRFREKSTDAYLWHIMSVIPLKNDKDVITQWIGFIVDINAQKQIEQTLKDNKELKTTQDALFSHQEELQQKVIELNRSNYELEQFAHLATHDLQEPLRKMFFYSDVLKMKYSGVLDQAGLAMLNSMTNAAGRMKELISDLLSYSQLKNKQIEFGTVDLNEVMQEIVRDLDVPIKEKTAAVEIDRLPVIEGNRPRLRQLFSNLLSNSLKYTRTGVSTAIQVKCESGVNSVTISVIDNGIGFDEAYKEKIFGLFERLHNKSEFPGTGIGLSICRRIAELHGGRISASSVPMVSTEFKVLLPLTQASPANNLSDE